MLRAWLIAVAAVVGACSAPPEPPRQPRCQPSGVPFAPVSGVANQNRPTTVELNVGAVCDGTNAFSVRASLYDDQNEPLAYDSLEQVLRPNAQDIGALVTFTARRPGWHHLVVTFEPNLGVAQADLLVAVDRRDAGAALSIPLNAIPDCTRVDVTPAGNVLCLAPRIEMYTNGQTQFIANVPIGGAHQNGTLWVVENVTVTRFVERLQADGGWAFEPASLYHDRVFQIVPAGELAVALYNQGPLVLFPDGGSMLLPTPDNWGQAGGLWSDGATVLIQSFAGHCTLGLDLTALLDGGFSPDGGAPWRCTPAAHGRVAAANSDGIWSQTLGDPLTAAWQLQRLDGFFTFTPPAGSQAMIYGSCPRCVGVPWDSAPAVGRGTRTWLIDFADGTISLSDYGDFLVAASGRWVAVQRDGHVDYIAR